MRGGAKRKKEKGRKRERGGREGRKEGGREEVIYICEDSSVTEVTSCS